MAYKIAVTEDAERDLADIVSYIAHDLANPTAAADLLDAVADCFSSLSAMPKMHPLCRDGRLFSLGYRRAVIKNYVMVYRADDAGHAVYVLRFFYGRREYEKLL